MTRRALLLAAAAAALAACGKKGRLRRKSEAKDESGKETGE